MEGKSNKGRMGIMIAVLIIPVLLIFFLFFFGENQHKLPVYFAIDSVEIQKGYKITEAETVPDFTLINHKGDTIHGRDLKGSIYVVDFFFTRCPDICPRMSNELARVQEEFKDDKEINILSVSIDPVRDSVSVLKEYAKQYRAKDGKWTFATGSPDSIYNLAQGHFRLTALNRNGAIDHSDKLVLVDKNGWIRGYYAGTNPKEVDRLITEIKVLKKIYASDQRPE